MLSCARCATREGEDVRVHMQEGAMSCWVSSVNAKYGLRGVQIREAAPGPASRRCWTQRLRTLQRSWDSNPEPTDEGRNVVRKLESQDFDTDDQQRLLRGPMSDVESLPLPILSECLRQICAATHAHPGESCWSLSPRKTLQSIYNMHN